MREMRLALGAATAVAVLSAACGGVENEPNLARAIERTESTASSRFDVRATERSFGRDSELTCDGMADYARKRMRLLCGEFGDFIAIGETLYFRGTTAVILGSRERWLKIRDSDEGSSIHDLSPVTLLAMLRAASRETEQLGDEEVRGIPTVGLRLTVDCEEAELDCEGETTPVDVWIDEEGLVRRIFLESGGTPGTIDFFDFGVEVDIRPPPDDQVDDFDGLSRKRCEVGVGTPVADGDLLDALRRHGFTMDREEECGADVAAILIGQVRKPVESGFLMCRVYDTPPRAAPSSPRTSTLGGVGNVRLRNLDCSLMLLRNAGGQDALRRLEETFAELERSIDP